MLHGNIKARLGNLAVLSAIKKNTFLMERTIVTANVPKLIGKPAVLQVTDQHGEDELVLPQRGVSFECLNNLSPVRLHAFLRVLYVLNLSTMQNRERVGDLAPSRKVGPATACDTMEGRVELVVPCGKAYFESEESLRNFLTKPVSSV